MLMIRSDEELEVLKREVVGYLTDHSRGVDASTFVFGCDGCGCRNLCHHAYDPYTIGGDCFADQRRR